MPPGSELLDPYVSLLGGMWSPMTRPRLRPQWWQPSLSLFWKLGVYFPVFQSEEEFRPFPFLKRSLFFFSNSFSFLSLSLSLCLSEIKNKLTASSASRAPPCRRRRRTATRGRGGTRRRRRPVSPGGGKGKRGKEKQKYFSSREGKGKEKQKYFSGREGEFFPGSVYPRPLSPHKPTKDSRNPSPLLTRSLGSSDLNLPPIARNSSTPTAASHRTSALLHVLGSGVPAASSDLRFLRALSEAWPASAEETPTPRAPAAGARWGVAPEWRRAKLVAFFFFFLS